MQEKYLVYAAVGIIAVVVAVAMEIYKKKKAERLDKQERLARLFELTEIAQSYITKVNTAQKPDARKGHLESAIAVLQQVIDEYPEEKGLVGELEKMKGFRVTLHTEIAVEAINKCMDKARTAKSVASRVNQAANALAVIQGAMREEFVDKEKMQQYQRQIEEFASQVQLDDYEQKAERLALKGQFSKAADACLDAIFHLKNDAIDDDLQAEQFQALEHRLAQYRQAAEEKEMRKSPRGKKVVDKT